MSTNYANLVVGKVQDVTTYAPSLTAGDRTPITADKDNGALLVHQADLEASKDTVSTVPVQSSSVTVTSVASDVASQTGVAANAARLGLILANADTGVCYVKFGTTATTATASIILQPNTSETLTGFVYTGAIDAIWTTPGAGTLQITELT